MNEHKSKHHEEGDSGEDKRIPRPPPKIEFPDPPNVENILGGTFPFKRSTLKKKERSRGGTPRSYSPSLGSPPADASSTDEESSRVHTPVKESPSLPKAWPQTDTLDGSSHSAPKQVKNFAPPKKKQYAGLTTAPTEELKFPPKQKQYSGKTTPTAEQLKTPPKQKQYSSQTTPTTEEPKATFCKQHYSGHMTPNHSPNHCPSSKQVVHQAPSVPSIQIKELSRIPKKHTPDLGATEIVIMDHGPSTMNGFHFRPSDVAHVIQYSQVQGIMNGDSRRLRPPPGMKVNRSWLVDAILQARQQKQQ